LALHVINDRFVVVEAKNREEYIRLEIIYEIFKLGIHHGEKTLPRYLLEHLRKDSADPKIEESYFNPHINECLVDIPVHWNGFEMTRDGKHNLHFRNLLNERQPLPTMLTLLSLLLESSRHNMDIFLFIIS